MSEKASLVANDLYNKESKKILLLASIVPLYAMYSFCLYLVSMALSTKAASNLIASTLSKACFTATFI